ncbi:MAG: hypothetical protein GEU95_09785 [Rhizobiales bacterium]|nr:hypothetical protein [Hyphomicrobiales bacterium]
MSPEAIQSFYALMLGFAWAGFLATGYQAVARRPASFHLLQRGPRLSAFAAIPLLVFAAPFIIMRTTLRARGVDGRRFQTVMVATVAAGIWSLMTGTVMVMAVTAMHS